MEFFGIVLKFFRTKKIKFLDFVVQIFTIAFPLEFYAVGILFSTSKQVFIHIVFNVLLNIDNGNAKSLIGHKFTYNQ